MPGMINALGKPFTGRVAVNLDSGVLYLGGRGEPPHWRRLLDNEIGPAIPLEVVRYSRSIRRYKMLGRSSDE